MKLQGCLLEDSNYNTDLSSSSCSLAWNIAYIDSNPNFSLSLVLFEEKILINNKETM